MVVQVWFTDRYSRMSGRQRFPAAISIIRTNQLTIAWVTRRSQIPTGAKSMMTISLRQSLVLAMGVCVSASVWAAGNGMELNSETDKTSYALGYQIGGDLRRQK